MAYAGRFRRLVAILMIAGLAVAVPACASDDTDSGTGNTDVALDGERFGTADADTAKLGTDAQPGVFPRTITHAAGTTQLEKAPARIVVLDTGELDEVLALGVTPVGMVTTEGAEPTPSYLVDKVKGVETVGTIQNVNIEKIATLKPDLILGSQLRVDKLYDQLSQVAPTVLSIRPGFPWKENFLLTADALGKEKEAVDVLNQYSDNAKALKDKVDPATTISLVRFMPGKLRLYANKSFAGVVLKDAGLARPKIQDVNELAVEISRENIGKADGDYIFYSSYGEPSATGESDVVSGPAWKQLSGVRDNRSFRVDDGVWFLGLGPIGAELMVTQLGEFLGK
ncbi:ABC transporter substrate-binding protein [Gordonia sp. (in: high G+C Gram-positive bacteria)]|uniref:ABC transporter substrate-binding protein n=1 Tax=Gordonia sp. (in: high G+C Gram-positive bacteria) TaxID=84139 RepID=UPI003F95B2D9